MGFDAKLKCLSCDRIYYLRGMDAVNIVPRDAEPGEAFVSICPFCKGQHAMLEK